MNTAIPDNCIISDDVIADLTGYTIPSKQCETLRDAGIFFIERRDGRPRTTWAHLNNPLKYRNQVQAPEILEPDFGALD